MYLRAVGYTIAVLIVLTSASQLSQSQQQQSSGTGSEGYILVLPVVLLDTESTSRLHAFNVVLHDALSQTRTICNAYYAASVDCQPRLLDYLRQTLLADLQYKRSTFLAAHQSKYMTLTSSRGWLQCSNSQVHENRIERSALKLSLSVQSSGIKELVELSAQRFNKEDYEIALHLACNVLLSPSTAETSQLRVASIIISEAAREMGDEEVATIFALSAAYAFSDSGPLDRVRNAVLRLRVLLSVPPMPPQLDEAKALHSRMVDGIDKLTLDFRAALIEPIPLDLFEAEISATPFHLAHQGLPLLNISKSYIAALRVLCPDLNYISPFVQAYTSSSPVSVFSQRRRLGFVSVHFFEHSIGKILYDTLRHLHLADNNFEVFIVLINRSGRDIRASDDIIIRGFNHVFGEHNFLSISGNLTSIRTSIEALSLDFLLFADIGMEMTSTALACMRIAPFQAAFWGHPVTSGSSEVDFFFSLDKEEKTAQEEDYEEQLVRFDFMSTAPIVSAVVSDSEENLRHQSLATLLGLSVEPPADTKICAVFGRLFKLHPLFISALAEILVKSHHYSPLIYVVMVAEKLDSWNEIVFARLKAAIASAVGAGVGASSDVEAIIARIRFVSYEPGYYLLLHTQSTVLALDTFPYGGCLTTHEALSEGIPMVTLPMRSMGGRYAAAMYEQMGIGDILVTQDATEYVELALQVLNNVTFHRLMSTSIREAYDTRLKQNERVAHEWAGFIRRLFV